jgi:hypothetical protein
MSTNTVHISVDDVEKSLAWLINNQPNSIFDSTFFDELRKWHNEFGAVFTLYIFSETEHFKVTDIPIRYAHEFSSNSNWLKFGYHSNSHIPFVQEKDYEKGFRLVEQKLNELGAGKTDILRLHYWHVTSEQKIFLRNNGVSCLLYPDDEALPYDEDDSFCDNSLLHKRTRIRFENLTITDSTSLDIGRCHIIAFTHEWCFPSIIQTLENALRIYSENGYKFI